MLVCTTKCVFRRNSCPLPRFGTTALHLRMILVGKKLLHLAPYRCRDTGVAILVSLYRGVVARYEVALNMCIARLAGESMNIRRRVGNADYRNPSRNNALTHTVWIFIYIVKMYLLCARPGPSERRCGWQLAALVTRVLLANAPATTRIHYSDQYAERHIFDANSGNTIEDIVDVPANVDISEANHRRHVRP